MDEEIRPQPQENGSANQFVLPAPIGTTEITSSITSRFVPTTLPDISFQLETIIPLLFVKKKIDISRTDTYSIETIRKALLEDRPVLKIIIERLIRTENEHIRSNIIRRCHYCDKFLIPVGYSVFFWQTHEFCDPLCLLGFQKTQFGDSCLHCKIKIKLKNLGPYCLRLGTKVGMFCSSVCLYHFQITNPSCSYCETILMDTSYLNSRWNYINNKGEITYVCSDLCAEKFYLPAGKLKRLIQCFMCNSTSSAWIRFENDERIYEFCCEPCFTSFCHQANILLTYCAVCREASKPTADFEKYSFFINNRMIHLCSKICKKMYILDSRKLITCQTCMVRKYTYDMIRKTFDFGQEVTVCSVFCLCMFVLLIEFPARRHMSCLQCLSVFFSHSYFSNIAGIKRFCSKKCAQAMIAAEIEKMDNSRCTDLVPYNPHNFPTATSTSVVYINKNKVVVNH